MFSVQGLLLGLRGYLIRFAPLAFIPHCQIRSREVPSLLLVHIGSTHFTATLYVLFTSPGLKLCSISCPTDT
jgi:hypothetical protein